MKALLSTSRCSIFVVSSSFCLYICLFIVHSWNVILEMGESSPRAALHGPRHGAPEVTDGPEEDDTEPSAVLGNMRYDCDNLMSVTTELEFAEAWRASSSSAVVFHHPSSHISPEPSTPGPFGEEAPLRNAPGYVSSQNSSAKLFASPEELLFRQPMRCPMDCVARSCRSKCTSAMCHRGPHVCPRHHYKGSSERDQDDPEVQGIRYDVVTTALFEHQGGCRRLLCDHPRCCRIIECCRVPMCRWCPDRHLCRFL